MTTQTLNELYEMVKSRQQNPQEGSYTAYLFAQGLDKILKKVGEETTEVIIAAKNDTGELRYETADLLFHLMVLLVNQGVSLAEIEQELGARIGQTSRLQERPDVTDY